MRIDAALSAIIAGPRATGGAASSGSEVRAEVSASTSSSGATSVDFTGMTRQDLFDWMNGKVRSGEMSLDESSTFLGMTLKIPVGAKPNEAIPLDDSEPVNFMDLARGGIAFAKEHGDTALAMRLQSALETMTQYQGTVSGFDIRV